MNLRPFGRCLQEGTIPIMSESNASRKLNRESRWLSRRGTWLLLLLVLPMALCGLLFILASWTPGWFQLVDPDDPAAADHGQQVEFRLAEEFQLIRPESEVWRLRIRDTDINAWLSTRLLPWLSHEQDFQWPDGVSRPQIRFTPGGLDVAARIQDVIGGDRVITVGFNPELVDGRMILHPGGIAIGRLPVPFSGAGVEAILQESLKGTQGAFSEFAEVAMGRATMEALIPLVDSRQVRLSGLKFESGAVVLEAKTVRNRD